MSASRVAARYEAEQALRGAVCGHCRQARIDAAQGLKFARGREALALALCGEANRAQALPGRHHYPRALVARDSRGASTSNAAMRRKR